MSLPISYQATIPISQKVPSDSDYEQLLPLDASALKTMTFEQKNELVECKFYHAALSGKVNRWSLARCHKEVLDKTSEAYKERLSYFLEHRDQIKKFTIENGKIIETIEVYNFLIQMAKDLGKEWFKKENFSAILEKTLELQHGSPVVADILEFNNNADILMDDLKDWYHKGYNYLAYTLNQMTQDTLSHLSSESTSVTDQISAINSKEMSLAEQKVMDRHEQKESLPFISH